MQRHGIWRWLTQEPKPEITLVNMQCHSSWGWVTLDPNPRLQSQNVKQQQLELYLAP